MEPTSYLGDELVAITLVCKKLSRRVSPKSCGRFAMVLLGSFGEGGGVMLMIFVLGKGFVVAWV